MITRLVLSVCLLCAAVAQAQNTLTLTGPTSITTGTPFTIGVHYNPSPNAAGLQWNFTAPVGSTITPAPVLTTKTLSCTPITNGSKCLLYGMNGTLVNGRVANYTITVPTGAQGPAVFSLALVIGVDVKAAPLVVTSAVSLSIPVTPGVITVPYDVNGDGVVNTVDVDLAVTQALGTAACTSGNVNGDAQCNIADVIRIIMLIMGL